jgi:ferric enterobactin receptor
MIERIEVIRGPAAARYGNGAAGGVVNIITKKPAMSGTAHGTPI